MVVISAKAGSVEKLLGYPGKDWMPDQVRHDTLAPFEAVTTRLKTNDPVYKDRVVCLKINQLAVASKMVIFGKVFFGTIRQGRQGR